MRLWNPHSGKHIKKFAGCHNQEVNDLLTLGCHALKHLNVSRISGDNSKFASCGSDKLILQWDVTTGQAGPSDGSCFQLLSGGAQVLWP